jgi:hypothetical protein
MFRLLRAILMGLVQWDWTVEKLLARLLWAGTGVMTKSRLDDPIYKKNVQRLAEHHRRFEEAKK